MEHRRRNSLRYPGHDYAQPGAVFVTVYTSGKQRLFGDIIDGRMVHSAAGNLVAERWTAIPNRFPVVNLDAFVVMPDHVHGILFTGANLDLMHQRITVGDVLRWFKTSTHTNFG